MGRVFFMTRVTFSECRVVNQSASITATKPSQVVLSPVVLSPLFYRPLLHASALVGEVRHYLFSPETSSFDVFTSNSGPSS